MVLQIFYEEVGYLFINKESRMETYTFWTDEDIKTLIKLYPNTTNDELSELLNKTERSISAKAGRLKLKKSKKFKSYLIAKRNKMVGRDLNFDQLQKIALKFKTRGEFQRIDSSAYTTARVKGFLNQICGHMGVLKFSIPQLILKNIVDGLLKKDGVYSDRQTIKPYEIDLYYPDLKLAFEYQGKRWHNNNPKDKIKHELMNKNSIHLFYIIENNRDYENDIKNQLIKIIPKLNKILKIKLTKETIKNFKIENPYKLVYNLEEIKKICQKYSSFKEFRNKEIKIYNKLKKLKLVDEYTSHMEKMRHIWLETELVEEIKKYKTLNELITYGNNIYSVIKNRKLNHLIDHLPKRKKLIF